MTTPCELVQIEYQGNGTLSVFAFPFPYDFKTEVKVALWNNTTKKHEDILTTDATYPWEVNDANPTAVTFTGTVPPAPPTADVNEDPIFNIRIYRVTDMTDIRSVFNQGSAIRATDLNKNFEQLRYAIQEGKCQVPDKLLEYLDEYYWNNYSDVVYSTETWASNDQTIATTAALDARFQDEANETIISSETWVADDDKIATTQSLEQRFDTLIETDILVDATGLTKSASGGQTTVGIGANSVDLDRIKTADIVQTSAYSSTWDSVDNKVATVGALAARLDAVVSTSQPTTTQTGKFWYNPTEGINALYMWNGTVWKVLTSGTPYIPAGTTIVRYVDQVNGSDDVNNLGFLPQSPLKTIKRAITLINASATGDGTLVVVEPGVYQEALPLTIQKNNVSVVGKSLRSCFIHPTVATENSNMWEVDSGTYISGFTMLGLKVPTSDQGSRNNAVDNDATYGLPSNQPFAVSFRSGNPVILKSPYVQNCTHFSDAHFDNANFDPNTFPSTDAQTYSAVAGDETSAPCGGGLLVDGSVPATTSPIRSMVVDAFTQITLDGPGILVTNNGYAQLVSFFGTFCHYHAKAKNGGQINLSNCVTDFGRYGLIAEGKSPTAIASATASAASSGATTVTIGAITSAGSFHGTVSRPLDHMMLTVDGNDYGVVSSTANGSGWDVTITPALSQTISNTAVTFALRSYISTGGHTFEYVGVGTDYSDHPDNGGVAIEANQVKQLSGGKVWQSSTDHIGKFKAGTVLTVDQIAETLAVNGSITVTGTNAINGNITVTGTVDGRDVATDGTKLDGIETGATADQTAAEIRTLVEAASDSNVFTDADHTKLNGIEASATADQTNAEIRTAVEAATDSNVFTDADHTKLNGIATGATAYANSDVDAHLNQSTASSGELLSWNGSDYDWIAAAAGYSDSSVDTHLNRSTAATGEVLTWNGSDYDWAASAGLSDTSTASSSLGVGANALDSETIGSLNTAFGWGAGDAVTTGSSNTIVGAMAGATQDSAHNNTYVGYSAGRNTTAGGQNSFYGNGAGQLNTAGASNTANGYMALYSNLTGDNNTADGFEALYLNTADNNTATGYKALRANTTGFRNTATGHTALTSNEQGEMNSAYGYGALFTNTNGDQNTGIGHTALYFTTGNQNTALGWYAGNNITAGDNNIVLGYNATASAATVSNEITFGDANITSLRIPGLQSGASNGQVLTYNSSNGNITLATAGGLTNNATYVQSLGVGTGALDSESASGHRNTAFGYNAGTSVTDGRWNILIGGQAGDAITTGDSNVAVGYDALSTVTTGDSNTAIGYECMKSVDPGATNNVAVGRGASSVITTGSDNVSIGNSAGAFTTAGTKNTAVGGGALIFNTIGDHNTATGYLALYANTEGDYNTATGYEALKANTTGSQNTAVGVKALATNTEGTENTAVGYNAGYSVTIGSSNTFLGRAAGLLLTEGASNVIIGIDAAEEMTTANSCVLIGGRAGFKNNGDDNVAVGFRALYNNTTGINNVAIGRDAFYTNTTGAYNVASGYKALYSNLDGERNVAHGTQALYTNTSGDDNVGIGHQALYNHTGGTTTAVGMKAGFSQTGSNSCVYLGWYAGFGATGAAAANNTCLGAMAGYGLTSGTNNTAAGYQALYSNTIGANNVAMGVSAMKNSIDASHNVIIGHEAGESLTNGDDNVAIGNSAGKGLTNAGNCVAVGEKALEVANQDGNTAVGYRAGQAQSSGENNTYIGKQAGLGNTAGSNTTIIGNSATSSSTTVSNEFTLGNSSISSLRCNTQTISSLSDGRDKTEVEDLPLGLNFIDTLRPVKFKWDTRDGNGKDGSFEAGFIAQDLQSAQSTSNADYLKMVMDENPDRLEAAYGQLIPVLVQAIKDLSTQVKQLQTA